MQTFAVVPIFVSAGAAVMPTIVAALASLAAVALKPRELVGVIRRRPLAVGGSVLGIALVLISISWAMKAGAHVRATSGQSSDLHATSHYDWAKVAQTLIAMEQAGKVPTSVQDAVASNAPGSSTTMPVALVKEVTNPAHPLYLGRDVSRSFYAGGPSPIRLNPLWTFQPEDTMFLSVPVVDGKRIFVAGCQSDLGSYTGLLACLDAETGKPIWQTAQLGHDPMRPLFSSPALSGDGKSIVIGQGLHDDRDCSLLCFDAANGQLRWAVKTTLHIESSPAIFGDMAVVGAGAVEGKDGRAVGDPGHVIAVRISDGKELWRQPVNDPESSPAVDDDGIVYVGSGFNGCAVVAIRSDPDELLQQKNLDRVLWRTSVALPVTSPITIAGDLVIAGAGNGDVVHSNRNSKGLVVALDRKTGQIRWQTPFDDSVLGSIACRDGVLICPCRTGEVTALSLRDGQVLWRTAISLNAPVVAGCAFTGTYVYAVSGDGYLTVLNAADGKIVEKAYLNEQGKPGSGLSLSSPQIVDGRVIVGSETGGMRCLLGSDSASIMGSAR